MPLTKVHFLIFMFKLDPKASLHKCMHLLSSNIVKGIDLNIHISLSQRTHWGEMEKTGFSLVCHYGI